MAAASKLIPKTLLSIPRKRFLVPKSLLNQNPNSKKSNFPSNSTLAALILSSALTTQQALAVDGTPLPPQPPPVIEAQPTNPSLPNSSPFAQNLILNAPKPQAQSASSDLPEGIQWRCSEFLSAVKKGKVERVRFSKDGSMLQLTVIDGRRAMVVIPNDPDLIDILAMTGVDISVSEEDGGNGLFNFIGPLSRKGTCEGCGL